MSTLRFGTRARSIKNNAKVNREYSIPELKKLLEKAESETKMFKMQVKVLEQELEKLGGQTLQSQDLIELAKQEERR